MVFGYIINTHNKDMHFYDKVLIQHFQLSISQLVGFES